MSDNKQLTGYPSIDKPWLKYYSEDVIKAPLPELSLYEYMYENNKAYPENIAINYFGNKISFGRLFSMIDEVAKAFRAIGVNAGDVVSLVTVSCVQTTVCFYALNKIGAISDYLNVLSEENDLRHFFEGNCSEPHQGHSFTK